MKTQNDGILLAAAAMIAFCCTTLQAVTKAQYLDIVEEAVAAYSPEHIESYLKAIQAKGIQEHGFPRLTANLGMLVAHGRRKSAHDKTLFKTMMDECCMQMSTAKARNGNRVGNDFTVKEIILCLYEIERSDIFPKEVTDEWRAEISKVVPKSTYTCIPPRNSPKAHNWAVFSGASEQLRCHAGLGGIPEFVERQFSGQLRWFDANGMYKDPNQPLVYDGVTRLQFMLALRYGYNGPSRDFLERQFLMSAHPTLLMQSVSGEIPFGGRSNQFLHNEGFFFALCEWYAGFFRERGDMRMAQRFRAAARRAHESLAYWLAFKPVRHVKNRYVGNSMYGCEGYAYFDKYMVTLGSWAMLGYLFADESIPDGDLPEDDEASSFVTTPDFHMTFLKAGGYAVQFDAPADPHYDGSGIGRIHRRGVPSMMALSVPFTTKPSYRIDLTNSTPLAIMPGWREGGEWRYAYDAPYTNLATTAANGTARMDVDVTRKNAGPMHLACEVSAQGVTITLKGEGDLALTLPAFLYDGERNTSITTTEKSITISLDGYKCQYGTDGAIVDTGLIYANRNGHYRRYEAHGSGSLSVNVTLMPIR